MVWMTSASPWGAMPISATTNAAGPAGSER